MTEFRPDARIVRHEAALVNAGQVLFNLCNGLILPRGVDSEVRRIVDPLHVGPEANPASEVQRQMRAQAARAGLRRRVDEARDGQLRGPVREVVALGVIELLVLSRRDNHVVDIDGPKPRGVDYSLRRNRRRLPRGAVLYLDLPAGSAVAAQRLNANNGRVESHNAAGVLKQTVQTGHQAVRVDNARRRTLQRAPGSPDALAVRRHLVVAHPSRRHANLVAAKGVYALERFPLDVVLRNNPFPRSAVPYAVSRAQLIQHLLAADA